MVIAIVGDKGMESQARGARFVITRITTSSDECSAQKQTERADRSQIDHWELTSQATKPQKSCDSIKPGSKVYLRNKLSVSTIGDLCLNLVTQDNLVTVLLCWGARLLTSRDRETACQASHASQLLTYLNLPPASCLPRTPWGQGKVRSESN